MRNLRATLAARRARRAAVKAEYRRAMADLRAHQEALTIRHNQIGARRTLPPVDGPYATQRELENA